MMSTCPPVMRALLLVGTMVLLCLRTTTAFVPAGGFGGRVLGAQMCSGDLAAGRARRALPPSMVFSLGPAHSVKATAAALSTLQDERRQLYALSGGDWASAKTKQALYRVLNFAELLARKAPLKRTISRSSTAAAQTIGGCVKGSAGFIPVFLAMLSLTAATAVPGAHVVVTPRLSAGIASAVGLSSVLFGKLGVASEETKLATKFAVCFTLISALGGLSFYNGLSALQLMA